MNASRGTWRRRGSDCETASQILLENSTVPASIQDEEANVIYPEQTLHFWLNRCWRTLVYASSPHVYYPAFNTGAYGARCWVYVRFSDAARSTKQQNTSQTTSDGLLWRRKAKTISREEVKRLVGRYNAEQMLPLNTLDWPSVGAIITQITSRLKTVFTSTVKYQNERLYSVFYKNN